MKIYVISEGSGSECALAQGLLDGAGCRYECLAAIDGIDGLGFFESVDSARYLINAGHPPAEREIGRYASHLYLWNLCVALDEPILVIEGSAELEAWFTEALQAIHALVDPYGLIRLDARARVPARPVDAFGRFTLSDCAGAPGCAASYAVAPICARAFIRASRVVVGPVEFFIQQSRLHGRPLYALSPPPEPRAD